MFWNYRVMRYEDGDVGIHEVYYDDADNITEWTKEPVGIVADDVSELKRILQMMASDIDTKPTILDYAGKWGEKPVVLEEKKDTEMHKVVDDQELAEKGG